LKPLPQFFLELILTKEREVDMKQPKKLTRSQKEACSAHHLNAEHWLLVEETEFYLKLINKATGSRRTIDKFTRKRSN
jgi:hypothetical protein